MIGEFFSISETNIGHAAMRAASRPIPQDAPAEMKLVQLTEGSGQKEVYIEVSTPAGFLRHIRVGQAKVWGILQIENTVAMRAACQHSIDDRAEHIRRAVLDAQEHEQQLGNG